MRPVSFGSTRASRGAVAQPLSGCGTLEREGCRGPSRRSAGVSLRSTHSSIAFFNLPWWFEDRGRLSRAPEDTYDQPPWRCEPASSDPPGAPAAEARSRHSQNLHLFGCPLSTRTTACPVGVWEMRFDAGWRHGGENRSRSLDQTATSHMVLGGSTRSAGRSVTPLDRGLNDDLAPSDDAGVRRWRISGRLRRRRPPSPFCSACASAVKRRIDCGPFGRRSPYSRGSLLKRRGPRPRPQLRPPIFGREGGGVEEGDPDRVVL